jgi:hypothetical protein
MPQLTTLYTGLKSGEYYKHTLAARWNILLNEPYFSIQCVEKRETLNFGK